MRNFKLVKFLCSYNIFKCFKKKRKDEDYHLAGYDQSRNNNAKDGAHKPRASIVDCVKRVKRRSFILRMFGVKKRRSSNNQISPISPADAIIVDKKGI